MQLFIIRHSLAVEMIESGVEDDAQRWLSSEGIERIEDISEGIKKLIPEIDCIFTSPFVRAEQTANIIAQAYSTPPPVEVTPLLQPGADISAIDKLAQKILDDGKAAFVGHQPDCSRIINELIGGTNPEAIEMRKGAVCRIDVKGAPLPGSGLLMWLLQPRVLRAVGK